jgi:hypothetical protein
MISENSRLVSVSGASRNSSPPLSQLPNTSPFTSHKLRGAFNKSHIRHWYQRPCDLFLCADLFNVDRDVCWMRRKMLGRERDGRMMGMKGMSKDKVG